mgnify:CR=1 FL=1
MEFNNETIRIAVQLYVKNEKEGEEKYGHINTWNVSGVTNMSYMFYYTKLFNQPLDNWNVSNVTNMQAMFCYANLFNQPLDNWNVSKVTKMFGMFCGALSFNQPLYNWNVSNITEIDKMFKYTILELMLKKHNLTNETYFVWPRKKDYVTFLVNNHYLPFNKHQEEHEYHPLFDNTNMSKYIACYL